MTQVLWITRKCPYPALDGFRRLTLSSLTALLSLGCRINLVVVGPESPGAIIPTAAGDITDVQHLPFEPAMGLSEIARGIFSRYPVNIAKHDSSSLIANLPPSVTDEQYALIVLDSFHLSTWLEALRRSFPGCPIVLRQHNLEWRVVEGHAEHTASPIKRSLLRWQAGKLKKLELKTIPQFDMCVSISDVERRELSREVPEAQVTTIPCAIDPAPAREPAPTTYDLCFIGRLDWYPNRHGLLWFLREVYPRVRQEHPGVTLAAIGLPADFPVSEFTGQGVTFTGIVEDSAEVLSSCRLFINPVFYGGGVRIKTLDVMALGLPMVSTLKGVEATGAVPDKHFLLAETADEFARRTAYALSHPAETNEMADQAKHHVSERFSPQVVSHAWGVLLERFTHDRTRP